MLDLEASDTAPEDDCLFIVNESVVLVLLAACCPISEDHLRKILMHMAMDVPRRPSRVEICLQ